MSLNYIPLYIFPLFLKVNLNFYEKKIVTKALSLHGSENKKKTMKFLKCSLIFKTK